MKKFPYDWLSLKDTILMPPPKRPNPLSLLLSNNSRERKCNSTATVTNGSIKSVLFWKSIQDNFTSETNSQTSWDLNKKTNNNNVSNQGKSIGDYTAGTINNKDDLMLLSNYFPGHSVNTTSSFWKKKMIRPKLEKKLIKMDRPSTEKGVKDFVENILDYIEYFLDGVEGRCGKGSNLYTTLITLKTKVETRYMDYFWNAFEKDYFFNSLMRMQDELVAMVCMNNEDMIS